MTKSLLTDDNAIRRGAKKPLCIFFLTKIFFQNMDNASITVKHNKNAHRWEATVNGQTAFTEYQRIGPVYDFTHTEVPESMQGQGIGAALVDKAMQDIRAEGQQYKASCSFVNRYANEKGEYADLKYG